MTADGSSAAALVAQASAVLFDFDGPICRLFADLRASDVAAHLRNFLERRGVAVPDDGTGDPLAVLRMSPRLDADLAADLNAELVKAELRAVANAVPTPGAGVVIRTLAERDRKIAVVSNNSARAVSEYLAFHRLDRYVSAIAARTSGDPVLMKPSPYLVEKTLSDLDVPPTAAVFVGDSVTDVKASIAAGVACIGYANKSGKSERLDAAGAVDIVHSMEALL